MKSVKYVFSVLFGAMLFLSSCNIATTVHFNKDYSGSYTMVMDLSELIDMAAMFDTTGTMNKMDAIEKMRHSLDSMGIAGMYESVAGIHDASVSVSDDAEITMGFNFDNVEALEASFKAVQEQTNDKMGDVESGAMDMLPTDLLSGGSQKFSRNGKTITHTFSNGETEDLLGGGESEDMDMFSSMIDYQLTFSFDRKIKSSEADGMTILEQTPKSITSRVDADRLLSGGYSIMIKTK